MKLERKRHNSRARQASEDAREKGRIANEKFFDELHKACEDAKRRSKSK